jgi:hypothetical protein
MQKFLSNSIAFVSVPMATQTRIQMAEEAFYKVNSAFYHSPPSNTIRT